MTSIAALLSETQIPRREAEVLLQFALQCDRTWLITHREQLLSEQAVRRSRDLLARRTAGEPVAYIVGYRSFWSLDLAVSPDVLIPRMDTEVLVEWAIALASQLHTPKALDLGTGSGAIALALKSGCPALQVTAVDVSPSALAVAGDNAERLAIELHLVNSDWFASLGDDRWPLIVSNPPYIRSDDAHLLVGDLPHEPRTALVSGADGLDAIRRLVAEAPHHLDRNGWLLLEHGYDQGGAVRALLRERGFDAIQTRRDLGGNERVTGGVWCVE